MTKATYSVARQGQLIVASGFKNYDCALNGFVGCEFACSYCYVRQFVKDPQKEWGDFVRIRAHVGDRLPKELKKGTVRLVTSKVKELKAGKMKTRNIYTPIPIPDLRLVIGTMTDPYQPAERKHRVTRTMLETLIKDPVQFKKVGIFTRSPIVLDDLDLIKQLPNARIHFTVTPFPHDAMRTIEPISPVTARRWEVCQKIKDAGIRLHVNVSPVMPVLSDPFIDDFADHLAAIEPAEFFVDPMQRYKDSWAAFKDALNAHPSWPRVEAIMENTDLYDDWKTRYRDAWLEKWHARNRPNVLPIWSDHENKVWVDMRTGDQMTHKHYGDEA